MPEWKRIVSEPTQPERQWRVIAGTDVERGEAAPAPVPQKLPDGEWRVIAGTDVGREDVEKWGQEFSLHDMEQQAGEVGREAEEARIAGTRVYLPARTGRGDVKELTRYESQLRMRQSELDVMKKSGISDAVQYQYYQQFYVPAWRKYEEEFTLMYGMGPETYGQYAQAADVRMQEYGREYRQYETARRSYEKMLGPLTPRPGETVVVGKEVVPTLKYYERVERTLRPYVEEHGVMYPKFPESVAHTIKSIWGGEAKPKDVELVYRGIEEKLRPISEPYSAGVYRAGTRVGEVQFIGPGLSAVTHMGARVIGALEELWQFGERLFGGRPGTSRPVSPISGLLAPTAAEMTTDPIKRAVTSFAAGAVYYPVEYKAFGVVSKAAVKAAKLGMAVPLAPYRVLARYAPVAVKEHLRISTPVTRFIGTAEPTKLVSALVPERGILLEKVRGLPGAVTEDTRITIGKYIGPGARIMGRTPFRQFYGAVTKLPGFGPRGRLGGAPFVLRTQMEAPAVTRTAGKIGRSLVGVKAGRRLIGIDDISAARTMTGVAPSRAFFQSFGHKVVGKFRMGGEFAKRQVVEVARRAPMSAAHDIPGFVRPKMLRVAKTVNLAGERAAGFVERQLLRPTLWRVRVPKTFSTAKIGKVFKGEGLGVKFYEKVARVPKQRRLYERVFVGAGRPPLTDPSEITGGMRISKGALPPATAGGVGIGGSAGTIKLIDRFPTFEPPSGYGQLGRVLGPSPRLSFALAETPAFWIEAASVSETASWIATRLLGGTAVAVGVGAKVASAQRQRLTQQQELKLSQRVDTISRGMLGTRTATGTSMALVSGVAQASGVAQVQAVAQTQMQEMKHEEVSIYESLGGFKLLDEDYVLGGKKRKGRARPLRLKRGVRVHPIGDILETLAGSTKKKRGGKRWNAI